MPNSSPQISIELLSFTVGDKNDWIGWYVFDNEMGKRGMVAGFKDKLEKVDTVDKLYNVIKIVDRNARI